MDLKTYGDALYGQFARIGKAVASPQRLLLLELLAQSERTVEVLADRAGMSVANASQHLQRLRRAGLVASERDGVFVVYRLAAPDVQAFVSALRALARQRLAEVGEVRREYLESRETMARVDVDSLADRIRRGEVTVVDVRPPEEFAASHLPGAISVPLEELQNEIDALPRDKEVVAYCRGPYCVLADEAVQLLRARGFNATCLEDGVLEMSAKGLEMVQESPHEEGAAPRPTALHARER